MVLWQEYSRARSRRHLSSISMVPFIGSDLESPICLIVHCLAMWQWLLNRSFHIVLVNSTLSMMLIYGLRTSNTSTLSTHIVLNRSQ